MMNQAKLQWTWRGLLILLMMVLPYLAYAETATLPAAAPKPEEKPTVPITTPAPKAEAQPKTDAPAALPKVEEKPKPEVAATAVPAPAPKVEEKSKIDSGNTAWMLTSTALVLFMTIPGLSLFYSGLVRSKNVLSVMMQCFAITSLVTVLWMLYGYSFAFVDGGDLNNLIGGASKLFLAGVDSKAVIEGQSIPEILFMTFQMTFAIITPALIVGAFAERMKFSALLWFMGFWLTFVYVPIAHWVWGGGWLGQMSVLDFAGGTVVHINAGVAGLVACILIGKRKGYPQVPMPPHNLTYTVIGASMLWVGWFGFNAGSQLAADGVASMAMAVTQIATAVAALAWMLSEWASHGKPSVLGVASGAVAGLVAITPASGTAGPIGALLIGAVAGVACFIASSKLKRAVGYDDSLDVFGVHAVGGLLGAILTGVCADPSLGGAGLGKDVVSMGDQVFRQIVGAFSTLLYTAIVSALILLLINFFIGLRVNEEEETQGLDMSLHDERGYIL